jgi:hypothetical protein
VCVKRQKLTLPKQINAVAIAGLSAICRCFHGMCGPMPIDMAGGSVNLTQSPRSLPGLLSPRIFLQSSGLGFLVAAYGSPAAAQLSLGSHTSVCLLPPPQLDHHTAMHMCWGSPAPGRGHGAKVAPCRRTNRRLQLSLSR